MPVGASIGRDQLDNIITSLAVRLRDLATDISELNLSVNGDGTGLAYLQLKGYSNDPNPDNPGDVSDAELALTKIGYLNTNSGVYFGTVQQGGTGGTGAILFSFHQGLSSVWAGQIGT
jgi:hypothetical protein